VKGVGMKIVVYDRLEEDLQQMIQKAELKRKQKIRFLEKVDQAFLEGVV